MFYWLFTEGRALLGGCLAPIYTHKRHNYPPLYRIVGPNWQHLREEVLKVKPDVDNLDIWFPR